MSDSRSMVSQSSQSVRLVARRPQGLLAGLVKARFLYLALIPSLVLLLLFEWYPAMSALYNSFFMWNGGKLHKFVGLDNFTNLLQDRAFLASLKNITQFVVFRVIAQTVVPFIAAELIVNLRNERWAERWKLIFITPMVVPYLLMILIWRFIYSPQLGLLNQTLIALGLEQWTRPWLADPGVAMWAISMIRFPWLPTLQFLILLSGLQAIPRDILESAEMDGAGLLARIRYVDIPLSMSRIKLVVLLTAIWMLQRFDLFLVLTDGGPGYSTMVPALHLYHSAFNFLEFGYASAIGVVLFIVMLLLTILNLRYVPSEGEM